jgi:hypothetical protein
VRHKALQVRQVPLNLTAALQVFGNLRRSAPEHAEAARVGQRLVREIQYLHRILAEVRETLPDTYDGYFDPLRLDAALGRTTVAPVPSQW